MIGQRFKSFDTFVHENTVYSANRVYVASTPALVQVVEQYVQQGKAKWVGLLFGRVSGRGSVGG